MNYSFCKQIMSLLLVCIMVVSSALPVFADQSEVLGSSDLNRDVVVNPFVATKIDGEYFSIVENTDKIPSAAVTACSVYGRGLTSVPGEKGSDPSMCWVAGSWGPCSNTCGNGEMARAVMCKDLNGNTIESCDDSLKLSDTRWCEGSSGCEYSWLVQEWGECAPGCGESEKHRFVDCYQNEVVRVENIFCSSTPKPSTVASCTSFAECGFLPVYGEWSLCSTMCGAGTQSRSAECFREDGTQADLASCGDLTTTKTCFETSECEYNWQYSEFGLCSSSCGFGTKTRSAECLRSDGSTVPNEMCLGLAELNESCEDYSGCGFAWNYGSWSQCSNSCGTGTQTRSADCMRSDGTVVEAEQCGAKEEVSTSCSSVSGCTYEWETTAWSACSETCGTGTQVRDAVCKRSDGVVVTDSFCTAPRPETSQSCSSIESCSYSWNYGSWGSCSTTCGDGTQTRTATCKRSDGTTVANGLCTDTAVLSQACTNVSNCSYNFEYSTWGSCSTNCGAGTQTRTAVCKRSDGATMTNSYCGTPSLSQSCSQTSGCTYSWNYGSWGSCSTTCGEGTQTRTAICLRSDGITVANSLCTEATILSQSCIETTGCSCEQQIVTYEYTSAGTYNITLPAWAESYEYWVLGGGGQGGVTSGSSSGTMYTGASGGTSSISIGGVTAWSATGGGGGKNMYGGAGGSPNGKNGYCIYESNTTMNPTYITTIWGTAYGTGGGTFTASKKRHGSGGSGGYNVGAETRTRGSSSAAIIVGAGGNRGANYYLGKPGTNGAVKLVVRGVVVGGDPSLDPSIYGCAIQ